MNNKNLIIFLAALILIPVIFYNYGKISNKAKMLTSKNVEETKVATTTEKTSKFTFANNWAELSGEYLNNGDKVTLVSPKLKLKTVTLDVAQSGSGARYVSSDKSLEFWEHQGEATLSVYGKEIFKGKLK